MAGVDGTEVRWGAQLREAQNDAVAGWAEARRLQGLLDEERRATLEMRSMNGAMWARSNNLRADVVDLRRQLQERNNETAEGRPHPESYRRMVAHLRERLARTQARCRRLVQEARDAERHQFKAVREWGDELFEAKRERDRAERMATEMQRRVDNCTDAREALIPQRDALKAAVRRMADRGRGMKAVENGRRDGRRVYLAARYVRRDEMVGHARELTVMGYEVTSRWINGSHELGDHPAAAERARLALEDYGDLERADIVLCFTEEPRARLEQPGRGGRHVEMGIALALGKRVVLIGPRENVFHHLPQAQHHEDWLGWLTAGYQTQTVTRTQAVPGDDPLCTCGHRQSVHIRIGDAAHRCVRLTPTPCECREFTAAPVTAHTPEEWSRRKALEMEAKP